MPEWIDRIQSAIAKHRHQLRTWQAGDGQLVFLPHGARLLGCAMPGVEGNLFFHHPAIENADTAGAQLTEAGGGLGGDRLWVGPEVAYMWTDLAEARKAPFDCSVLPEYMDPGQWKVIDDADGAIHLTNEMTLVDHRFERKITLEVGREVHVIDPPADLPSSVHCAAFMIRNAMTVVGGDDGAVAGLWDLLQMPVGGVLVCPTLTPVTAPPRSYYEPYRPGDVERTDRAVHFHTKGDHIIKMGLAPQQTTGRMAYLRRVGDAMTAIVRSFLPAPGAPYIDLPRDSADVFGGDALQAFCDDGRFQGFCEMEYHETALICGQARTHHCGACITQVLAGQPAKVEQAAAALIGVPVEELRQ